MNRTRVATRIVGVFLIVVVFALPTLLAHDDYLVSVLILTGMNILMTASLRSIALLQQISLGHVGFSLIGAYGSALLMLNVGLPFWPSLILGGLCAALVALVLGYPFLKVKGIYFTILTLLTAETFRLIAYYWKSLTGGSNCLMGIPSPELSFPLIGTIAFDTADTYYYLVTFVVLVCLLILYLVERSHLGLVWKSIKDSEELSQSVGVNVIGYRVVNFVIACFFAGISGALFAHYQLTLSPALTSRFGVFTSIYLIVYLVVGGIQSFAGPIVGTLVLTLISELTRVTDEYQPIIIGVIAILVVLFMPGALTGFPRQIIVKFSGRKEKASI